MGQPGMPGSQFPGEDAMIREIRDLRRLVQQFAAANVLATAGISAADGGVLVNGYMEFKREDGTVGVRVDPSDGTFTALDSAGTSPVARFGALLETDPGEYGVEVLVGSTWVKLGAQAVTWDLVSGKPGWASDPASIAGTNISGTVANATASVTATHADGVTNDAFNRNIAGIPGTYVAMWMHSNGQIGYNTSDEKYKRNVRDYAADAEDLMSLRATIYDRKATNADDYTPPVSVDELGLIAGETASAVPELAIKRNGELDGVLYERLPVFLLPFVQAHERAVTELRAENATQAAQIAALTKAVRELGGNI